jgi:hypothetical protein
MRQFRPADNPNTSHTDRCDRRPRLGAISISIITARKNPPDVRRAGFKGMTPKRAKEEVFPMTTNRRALEGLYLCRKLHVHKRAPTTLLISTKREDRTPVSPIAGSIAYKMPIRRAIPSSR